MIHHVDQAMHPAASIKTISNLIKAYNITYKGMMTPISTNKTAGVSPLAIH